MGRSFSSSWVLGVWLVLLVIFASHGEMMKGAEGHRKKRVCQSLSHGFRGLCFHDHNCALVCRNEAFSGGRCHGFRRRCFCTKFCNPEEYHHSAGATTTTTAMTTTKN